jgi:hypothetical protein
MTEQKKNKEICFAREQKELWQVENKSKKCEKCLDWLNYCQFWTQNYECEITIGENVYEAKRKAFK